MDLEAKKTALKNFSSLDKKKREEFFRKMQMQMANPYTDKVKGACLEACPDPETSEAWGIREHDGQEELVEDSLRVATRARLTYELYSFSKNALLIVSSSSDASTWTMLVEELRRTFQGYRFEVESCEITDTNDLYGKCEQFLQRDFTDYGAVALAIVTSKAGTQGLNSRNLISFATIAENFKLERNPTLANKPKIYITESNRRNFSPSHQDKLVLDRATHGDVIGFHVPLTLPDLDKSTTERRHCPLNILCEKMAAMANDNNFASVIDETVKESLIQFPLLEYVPIDVVNTLSKELYLAKVEENH